MVSRRRPPRRQKIDTFLTPDMQANEAKCHSAIAPLDRLANKMDAIWGVDRLPELVPPDMAARYGSALGRLMEALREKDADKCIHMAQVCMRGLKAMHDHAEANGAEKPNVLAEYKTEDGFHFVIVADAGDWKPICEDRPGLRVYSLREVANALKQTHGIAIVDAIKTEFPGAQVREPVKPLPKSFWDKGGDELPW